MILYGRLIGSDRIHCTPILADDGMNSFFYLPPGDTCMVDALHSIYNWNRERRRQRVFQV